MEAHELTGFAPFALWADAFGGPQELLEALGAEGGWNGAVARTLRGLQSPEALLAEALEADAEDARQERLAEAHGYLGMWCELRGAPGAPEHYEAALATGVEGSVYGRWARLRLEHGGL